MKILILLLGTVLVLVTPSRSRASSAGSLDTTFNPGTGPNGSGLISAAVTQADGKVIVTGYFTNFNGVAHPGIVRLNENGSVDTSFNHGSGFDATTTVALALTTAVQSDGKILVGGAFNMYDEATAYGLLRLNADGTVDSGFFSTNIQIIATSLSVLENGKILVGLNGSPGLIRVNSDGSIDTNFFLGYSGPSLNGSVNTIAVQSDGKILVSGTFTKHFTSISDSVGTLRKRIARLNADGTLDPSFDAGVGPIKDYGGEGAIDGMALQTSGKIIVGGTFTNFSGMSRGGVVRLDSTGAVDPTFNSDPGTTRVLNLGPALNFRFTGAVYDVAVDPNDRVLLAGSFGQYNLGAGTNVVRLTSNGALDTTFDNRGPNVWTSTLSLQLNGKIIVSGFFTNVSGVARPGLARLNGTSSTPVAPTISTQPVSQSVTNVNDPVGPTVTFSVVAGGTEPFTYQWLYNGAPLSDGVRLADPPTISGSHSASVTITHVTARNAGKYSCIVSNVAGKVTSAAASLFVNGSLVPDITRPVVTVTSPAAPVTRVFTNSLNIVGKATDLTGITEVLVRTGTDVFLAATGTTNWSATVALVPGTNVIGVKALDLSGNSSITNTRVVVYAVSNALSLVAAGEGTIKGATNGQFLEIGKLYTLTATPKAGNLFSNWTSGSSAFSTNPVLKFLMSSNLDLTASFVTNPFIAAKGVYSGLVMDTNNVTFTNAGLINLTVSDKGVFSGKLLLAGASLPLAGSFGVDGTATVKANRPGKPALTNHLVLDLASKEALGGSVSDGAFTNSIQADKAVFATTNPAPYAGRYTLIVPGTNEVTGDGIGTVSVSPAGTITFAGNLADGTVVSQSVPVSRAGWWPVYLPLYVGKGMFISWAQFDTNGAIALHGDAVWIKNPAPGRYFTNGFKLLTRIEGGEYEPPAVGPTNLVLATTNGSVTLHGGNLTTAITNGVVLTNNNVLRITGTNGLKLTIVPSSGLVNGTFIHPVTKLLTPIKGVVQQGRTNIDGFFLGPNASGTILLQP